MTPEEREGGKRPPGLQLPKLLDVSGISPSDSEDVEEEEEETRYPCYEFNTSLPKENDDGLCIHCRKYLTLECEHLEDFMDELDVE